MLWLPECIKEFYLWYLFVRWKSMSATPVSNGPVKCPITYYLIAYHIPYLLFFTKLIDGLSGYPIVVWVLYLQTSSNANKKQTTSKQQTTNTMARAATATGYHQRTPSTGWREVCNCLGGTVTPPWDVNTPEHTNAMEEISLGATGVNGSCTWKRVYHCSESKNREGYYSGTFWNGNLPWNHNGSCGIPIKSVVIARQRSLIFLLIYDSKMVALLVAR